LTEKNILNKSAPEIYSFLCKVPKTGENSFDHYWLAERYLINVDFFSQKDAEFYADFKNVNLPQ
jgi:hypothetical protein